MILHLLTGAPNPLALQVLGSRPHAAQPPLVVLLSPGSATPELPQCTVYRLTEDVSAHEEQGITYPHLVDLIFKAERVIVW
jgi:hypothetical protein